MHRLLKFARRKPGRKPVPRVRIQAKVPEVHGAQFAAAYYDQRIGGDYHDFFRVSPTRVLFGLLDVAGRAVENRRIVRTVQQTFHSLGERLLGENDVNEADAMIDLCIELNRVILKTAGRARSSPAFAACYNESLGTVCYVNAGHTPGLVRDNVGVIELPATGLPLGLFSHATADASIVALQPGAALLLVSRGLVEATHKSEEFGLEQVKDTFRHTGAETSQEICGSVLDRFQEFTHKSHKHNDVTVLALARNV